MRCIPVDTDLCASVLSQLGGVNYVVPGREGRLIIAATGERPAREVTVVAEPRPDNRLFEVIVALDTLAGILVVLGAAWLVWTRPGAMTWGFFVYVIQFNPGQAFQIWAWAQLWPWALLAQDFIAQVMQAAAYTGLLLFALRAPLDRTEGRWRNIERALPAISIVFLAVSLAGMGSVFGYRAEIWARSSLFVGLAVSVAAVAILLGRRRDLSPRDYQRIRWVIWGCLIGLPAYLLAQLSQETSLFAELSGPGHRDRRKSRAPSTSSTASCACSSSRRCGGRPWSTCGFRCAARPCSGSCSACRSSSSTSRSKRSTNTFTCRTGPGCCVASGLVYLIARAHEFTTELADRLFDREFIRAERHLSDGRRDRFSMPAASPRSTVSWSNEPMRSLNLASAALFREQDGVYRRRASAGWDADDDRHAHDRRPHARRRDSSGSPTLSIPRTRRGARLPHDLARPLLAVPVGNPRRCYAMIFYSGHEAGTDLDSSERHLLGALAHDAEIAYAQIESEMLHKRVAMLEGQLKQAPEAADPAGSSPIRSS